MAHVPLISYLRSRGLVHSTTHETWSLCSKKSAVYLGIDPTSSSLHLGHLLGVLTLRAFAKYGFKPIALVGGATGMIGDPSGRDSERSLLSVEEVKHNAEKIKTVLQVLVEDAQFVNNLDWYGEMSSISLLRDVGKHFRVSTMLSRDSVKSRMDQQDGISFTEFSYQLLQGNDFLHLYRNLDCGVQIGGSDQWGNIVSGVDLIRRVEKANAYGLTLPLLTTSTGQKFGKSAGNAIWLDSRLTSDYTFYQYMLRTDDLDVENLLLKLTEAPTEEIASIMQEHGDSPHKRIAQEFLASSVTRMVRGDAALCRAKASSKVLFGGPLEELSPQDLLSLGEGGDIPIRTFTVPEILTESISSVFYKAGLTKSKSETRRLIKNGGAYINNKRVETDESNFDLNKYSFKNGGVSLLRSGKKQYTILKLKEA